LAPPLGKARENAEHALAVLRAARPCAAVAAEIEVLADAHVRENAPALRHVDQALRDDLGGARALDPFLRGADRAAPGAHHARDRAVERRLAGAVRAEHGDDLALVHGETDATQDLGRTITGVQSLHVEQRLSHAALPACVRLRRVPDRPRPRA